MSDRSNGGGGGAATAVPPPLTAAALFEAQAAARADADGPWALGGWTWSVAELQLPTPEWNALLGRRGVTRDPGGPPDLMALRRRMMQRVYAAEQRARRRGGGPAPAPAPPAGGIGMDTGDDDEFGLGLAAVFAGIARSAAAVAQAAAASPPAAAAVPAEQLFASSAAAKAARNGPWEVQGCGLWTLTELQVGRDSRLGAGAGDKRAWKRLLAHRGIARGKVPAELAKLRRKMLGRIYAQTTSSNGKAKRLGGGPASSSSSPPPPPVGPGLPMLDAFELVAAEAAAEAAAARVNELVAGLEADEADDALSGVIDLALSGGIQPVGMPPELLAWLDDDFDAL